MSEKVSSFMNVSSGRFRYVFYFVTWNDFVTQIREQLAKQLDPFGEALGERGKVVQAFDSMSRRAFEQVIEKGWSAELKAQISDDPDPFLLVIDQDFASFDPGTHRWGLVRLSSFYEKPDSIYRLLAMLARRVQREEDVFEYLRTVVKRKETSRFSKYLEIKPGIFGVSVDISAILEDLLE